MGLGRYIARKTIYTILVLLVVVAFNFFLFQILPFSASCPNTTYDNCVARLYLPTQPPRGCYGSCITDWQNHTRTNLFNQYGFNQPVYVRFLLYYQNMFTFNFGYNLGGGIGLGGPVISSITLRTPYTLLLLGTSTIASFLIGIALGVVASAKRGKVFDVSSLSVLLFLNALPVFFLGAMLELLQVTTTGTAYANLGKATSGVSGWGVYAGTLQAMFLPFVTLTLAGLGGVFLTQRAVMIDTIGEDYVMMARAKGVPERTVLYKHALRNAVLPIVTAFALTIGFILTGAIITETVFQWPGLGHAIFIAVSTANFPFAQAMFFIITVMVLVAIFVADLLYGFLDPRVSRD
jgi:peptide/nickel transport system permease protein